MNNQIYFNKNFFDKLKDFSKSDQKRIMQTIDDLSKSAVSNSLQLHSLDKADCDQSFRSVRVNSDIRVILSQSGNRFIILYVDHHEEAYNWAKGKKLVTNDYNSTFLYDDSKIATADLKRYNTKLQPPLLPLRGVKKKHLMNLGLNDEHSELLMEVTDLDFLSKFVSFLPDELQEAIIDLALENKSIDEVLNAFEEINEFDNMHNPNSLRRFIDKDEIDQYDLDELITNFDAWKLFLHPKQREYVDKFYNGPVLIEGGPGTGKTIVGIHRALHLAKNVYDESSKIYFIVFNKRLVEIVKHKFLEIQKLKGTNYQIEVTHVDKLIVDLLNKSNIKMNFLDNKEMIKVLKKAYEDYNCNMSLEFIINEYFEVIRNKRIKNLDEYYSVVRHSQGNRIRKKTREAIWPIFECAMCYMSNNNLLDFEMRAALLEQLIDSGEVVPFIDSMIIDEAQDLTAQKLITLKKLIKSKKNNLFILSDKNQRIYSLFSWKNDVDIKIKGRTYYLSLNYRTTREIKEFADLQFFEKTIKSTYEKEYKSLLTGPLPKEKEFSSKAKSKKYLVEYIKSLVKEIPLEEICIISDNDQLLELSGVFDYAEIPSVNFAKMNNVEDLNSGVNLIDVNLVKGLEYRVVVIYNIPFEDPEIESIEDEDEYLYMLLYQKYECKKYVALTRARDFLLIINVEEE